jgi:hypothetical protein
MNYYRDREMYRMPECAYPIEYHRRYGYMYPDMETEVEDTMVYPIMYPEIYYRVYPYVCRVCDRMDNPYVPYPSQAQVESMVDECYDMCMREMPDLEEYVNCNAPMREGVQANQRFRRPIFRDLISIILISELFRRRRRRRRDRRRDDWWY